MSHRLFLISLLCVCVATSSSVAVEKAIRGEGGGSGPVLGGGGGELFPVTHPSTYVQEPYRNADIGTLGVVLSNGEFHISVTDMEIPGRGFPLELSRTYRSKKNSNAAFSLMGTGWHLSYDEYLAAGTYFDSGGYGHESLEWTMGNGWSELWVDWAGEGQFTPFNGFFGKIRWQGTSVGYQIRYPDGTVKTFGQYVLRPGSASVYAWVLTRIEDRNGNVLTIQYEPGSPSTTRRIHTVTDTLGRTITLGYDSNNLVTSVTDFALRRVDYHYDSRKHIDWVKAPEVRSTTNITNNNFCEPTGSTCQALRKKTTYVYNGSNCSEIDLRDNLISIVDGESQTFLTNTYNSQADPDCGPVGGVPDFVVSQQYGGGTVTYAYESFYPPDSGANTLASRTTVTDRGGSMQVHDFNPQGNPIRIEYRTNRGIRTLGGSDEPNYVETYTYVDNGVGDQPMLVSQRTESGGLNVDSNGNLISYSSGMTVQYTYDQTNPDVFQRGNLLSVTRTPGARGAPAGQSQIVTSTTREPLFNQPLTTTDPRGHVASLTYDYQEGSYLTLVTNPTAAVNPGWWSNGEIQNFMAGTNANKGDLNGDGLVGYRGGNLIQAYDGQATGYDGTLSGGLTTTYAYNGFGLPTIRRDAEQNEIHFLYYPENDPDGNLTLTPQPSDRPLLSPTVGNAGGGYLKQKVLDATPTPPRSEPTPQNVTLSFEYDPVGNVTRTTDGRGIRTDYLINELNQIVQVTHAAASTDSNAPAFSYREQFIYDANNNVVQHKTERRDDGSFAQANRWITLVTTYDTLDRKISETISTDDTPAINLTTSYAYDANGNLTKTVFPALNVVLRKYDERDLLYEEAVLKTCTGASCSTYNPAVDSVTRHDYDGSGNLIQLTDPEGHTARTGYDGYNRKVVGFDPALQKTTFSYDPGGNILEQASFGSLGGATPTGPPGGSYPELSRQKLYYDELSRMRRTDTKFFKYLVTTQTLLTTDSNAGLTGTPPDGTTAVGDGWVTGLIKYDRLGRVTRATDDNAHVTETRYDGLGRKLKVFLNPVAPFSDTSGTGTDERNAAEYQYDKDNNLTRTIETERGLDRSGGTARKLTTPQQYQTDFKFDSMNRLVETKLVGKVGATPLNYTTAVVYDSRGNKVQITDPAGGRVKSTYDGLNRLLTTKSGYLWNGTTETTPLDNTANPDRIITTTYAYDTNSRLLSIKDDNLRLTSFTYDNLNRQTRITYPDASYKEITYNRDSLAMVWDHCKTANCSADKLRVSTQFDALHRATQKDVDNSLAAYFIGTKRQNFEYDGLGRMTRAVDDLDPAEASALIDSEVRLAYNSLGKVIAEDQKYGVLVNGSPVYTTNSVSSDYNGVGFRTQLTYPGARTVTLTPDELNRLGNLTDSFTGATKYDYLGPSRVLNRIYPNTTKLTMLSGPTDNVGTGYDDARRVVDWANKGSAAPPNVPPEFTYGFDAANNRLFERRVHQPNTPNWKGERYTYDAVYRLINRTEGDLNADGALMGAPTPTQTFTLDGLGNWKSHTKAGTSYTNTVNTLNQYTQFQGAQGARDLSYDFAGNLLSEGTGGASYAYDFANRLVTFQSPGGTLTTYRYDALGRRISKSVGGTSLTRFIYDGDRLIEERDGLNVLVASYVSGIGSNEVLTRRRWTTPANYADLFYHTNALGSVTAVTSTSGAVVERYQYDGYGKPMFLAPDFTTLPSSTVFNTILFTGQYFDVESGNYYYRARYYHPYLGRFLQRDPLGEAASLNLYAYVLNNPVNATDPSGMKGLNSSQKDAAMKDGWQAVLNMDGGARGSGGWDPLAGRRGDDRLQGNDMEWQRQLGISRYHNDRVIERQEKRLEALKKELDTSAKDLNNIKAMDDPKGVEVNALGFRQSAAKERSGKKHNSQLDEDANEKSLQGQVAFTVSAKNMMVPGTLGEVSGDALQIVADAVKGVTDKLCGNMHVEINGFSQGGGPAVGLANMLTGPDYGLSGSNFTTNLIDPYMSKNWNTINDPDVHVNVYRGTRWDPVSIVVNWGAHLFGLGNRDVYQGAGFTRVNPLLMHVGHTHMDSYYPGAMGTFNFLGY